MFRPPLPTPDPPLPMPDADAEAPTTSDPPAGLPLLAAALAWVFPGLGHLLLGRVQRGLVLAVAITTLYLAGLLIGGVSVIDRRDHPAWFLSQALIGPSLLLDRYHQNLRDAATRQRRGPGDADAYAPAFGRAQEQGTLYTAAAGLLNLLAMLDAASRRPGHERRRGDRRDAAPAPARLEAAPAAAAEAPA